MVAKVNAWYLDFSLYITKIHIGSSTENQAVASPPLRISTVLVIGLVIRNLVGLGAIPTRRTCPFPVPLFACVRRGRRASLRRGLRGAPRTGGLEIPNTRGVSVRIQDRIGTDLVTLVPDQPNLNAASFATNSPKPSMRPFMKGRIRFIAAPLNSPHSVGGLYSINGDEDEDGAEGDAERGLLLS